MLRTCHWRANQLELVHGEMLGIIAIVQVMHTDISGDVPCYVLDSSKPLWSGEVSDCGIVRGINALSSLRDSTLHTQMEQQLCQQP